MEPLTKSRDVRAVEAKPNLTALVTPHEFRQSIKRITSMNDEELTKYAAPLIVAYAPSLTESGIHFDEQKKIITALASLNHALFDRSY